MDRAGVHETEIKLNETAALGHLRLAAPATLNAVSLEMVEAIQHTLHAWETRPEIVAILIDADDERAFSAGGDIVRLYRAITGTGPAAYPAHFFAAEYRLCHDLRTLQTPCIAWGDGIVMGGGFGIFAAARHRVVTEHSRLAMPEIKIGLFPDCAATWFFNRLPRYLGRFIALTGSVLNADDALFAGLADHAIAADQHERLLAALSAVPDWSRPDHAVDSALRQLQEGPAPVASAGAARLVRHLDTIRAAADGDRELASLERLMTLAGHGDPWLAEAGRNLVDGCPVTARLTWQQLARGRTLSLREALQMEWHMAMACCARPDFAEGVRALLVDKDRAPNWSFGDIHAVPTDYVAAHFERPPAITHHPLADLGDAAA